VTIAWVPVHDSLYSETIIADYQAAYDPSRPLASLSSADVDKALVEICKKIKVSIAGRQPAAEPDQPMPATAAPVSSTTTWPPPPVAEVEEPQDLILNQILPGAWRVQIQLPMPGAMGIMQLQIFPNGMFHGELTAPMGRSVVEGQWQANPFMKQIGLQGMENNGFQVIPYGAVIQVNRFDTQQIWGVSSGGEQIVFQRIG
jgi:hypothetical protein